jgi:hypothetical protein
LVLPDKRYLMMRRGDKKKKRKNRKMNNIKISLTKR